MSGLDAELNRCQEHCAALEAELARLREPAGDVGEVAEAGLVPAGCVQYSRYSESVDATMAMRNKLKAAEAELARLREPAGDVGEVVKQLGYFAPPIIKTAADILLRQAGEIEEAQRRYDGVYAQWGLAAKLCDEHRTRATSAEALLREAGDRINQLIDALGSTSMGQKDGARRSALKFLAKLEPAPEPVREDTYPDRVSMEPWPYSGHAPGGSDAK